MNICMLDFNAKSVCGQKIKPPTGSGGQSYMASTIEMPE